MASSQSTARSKQTALSVYLVIVGRFTVDTGYFMVLPFLTVYVTELGMSGFEAGALFAILQAMKLGFGVPAGWASDRFGPFRILILGLVLEAVSYLLFTGAGRSFAAWAVAVGVLGLGGALNSNGSRSLLTALDDRASATALNLSRHYIAINGAGLIGPLIGAVLIAADMIKVGFLIAAALHVLFAIATAPMSRYMRRPEAADATNATDSVGAAASGAESAAAGEPATATTEKAGWRDGVLMHYCAIAIGGWFLVSQFRIGLSLSIVHQGLPREYIGPLTTLNAILVMVTVALFAKRIANSDARGRLNVFGLSAAVLGIGWLLGVLPGVAGLIAVVVVISVGESLFLGVVDAIVVMFAPKGYSGQYLGYSSTAWGVGAVFAGFSGAAFDAGESHGVLPAFWLGLALVGLVAAVAARFGRDKFIAMIGVRQPAQPEQPAQPAQPAEQPSTP